MLTKKCWCYEEYSIISKVPYIIKLNKSLLQCYMHLIYSTEVSLFFILIPEAINAFVTFWHEFKKLYHGINQAVVFVTIHDEPSPIFLYCGINNLPSVFQQPKQMGV